MENSVPDKALTPHKDGKTCDGCSPVKFLGGTTYVCANPQVVMERVTLRKGSSAMAKSPTDSTHSIGSASNEIPVQGKLTTRGSRRGKANLALKGGRKNKLSKNKISTSDQLRKDVLKPILQSVDLDETDDFRTPAATRLNKRKKINSNADQSLSDDFAKEFSCNSREKALEGQFEPSDDNAQTTVNHIHGSCEEQSAGRSKSGSDSDLEKLTGGELDTDETTTLTTAREFQASDAHEHENKSGDINLGPESPADAKMCVICNNTIGNEDLQSHLKLCLNKHFNRAANKAGGPQNVTDEVLAQVLQQTEDVESCPTLELVLCQICNVDLSDLSPEGQIQHVNACIDKNEAAQKTTTIIAENQAQAKQPVLDCPICGKPLKTILSRKSHLNKCAKMFSVDSAQLNNLIELQKNEYELNLVAGVVPVAPEPKQKSRRPTNKSKKPPKNLDEDTQIAMALSTSIVEEQQKQEAQLLNQLESVDRLVLGCKKLDKDIKKGRKKKNGQSCEEIPLLLRYTAEEIRKKIAERVAMVVTPAYMESLHIENTPPMSHSVVRKVFPANSGRMGQSSADNPKHESLWKISSLNLPTTDSYYVKELHPFVQVSSAQPGKLLRHLSDIPGRRKSEDNTGGHSKAGETAVEDCDGSIADMVSTPTAVLLAELADDTVGDTSQHSNEVFSQSATGEECMHLTQSVPSEVITDSGGDNLGNDTEQCSGFCPESESEKRDTTASVVTTLHSDLVSMVNNPLFSDVKILVRDEQVIYAHKMILAARCPQLSQILQQSCNDLHYQKFAAESVLSVMRFIYAGELPSKGNLEEVWQVAERIGLSELSHILKQENTDASDSDLAENGSEREDSIDELLNTMFDEPAEQEADEESIDEDKEEEEMASLYHFVLTQKQKAASGKVDNHMDAEGSSDEEFLDQVIKGSKEDVELTRGMKRGCVLDDEDEAETEADSKRIKLDEGNLLKVSVDDNFGKASPVKLVSNTDLSNADENHFDLIHSMLNELSPGEPENFQSDWLKPTSSVSPVGAHLDQDQSIEMEETSITLNERLKKREAAVDQNIGHIDKSDADGKVLEDQLHVEQYGKTLEESISNEDVINDNLDNELDEIPKENKAVKENAEDTAMRESSVKDRALKDHFMNYDQEAVTRKYDCDNEGTEKTSCADKVGVKPNTDIYEWNENKKMLPEELSPFDCGTVSPLPVMEDVSNEQISPLQLSVCSDVTPEILSLGSPENDANSIEICDNFAKKLMCHGEQSSETSPEGGDPKYDRSPVELLETTEITAKENKCVTGLTAYEDISDKSSTVEVGKLENESNNTSDSWLIPDTPVKQVSVSSRSAVQEDKSKLFDSRFKLSQSNSIHFDEVKEWDISRNKESKSTNNSKDKSLSEVSPREKDFVMHDISKCQPSFSTAVVSTPVTERRNGRFDEVRKSFDDDVTHRKSERRRKNSTLSSGDCDTDSDIEIISDNRPDKSNSASPKFPKKKRKKPSKRSEKDKVDGDVELSPRERRKLSKDMDEFFVVSPDKNKISLLICKRKKSSPEASQISPKQFARGDFDGDELPDISQGAMLYTGTEGLDSVNNCQAEDDRELPDLCEPKFTEVKSSNIPNHSDTAVKKDIHPEQGDIHDLRDSQKHAAQNTEKASNQGVKKYTFKKLNRARNDENSVPCAENIADCMQQTSDLASSPPTRTSPLVIHFPSEQDSQLVHRLPSSPEEMDYSVNVQPVTPPDGSGESQVKGEGDCVFPVNDISQTEESMSHSVIDEGAEEASHDQQDFDVWEGFDDVGVEYNPGLCDSYFGNGNNEMDGSCHGESEDCQRKDHDTTPTDQPLCETSPAPSLSKVTHSSPEVLQVTPTLPAEPNSPCPSPPSLDSPPPEVNFLEQFDLEDTPVTEHLHASPELESAATPVTKTTSDGTSGETDVNNFHKTPKCPPRGKQKPKKKWVPPSPFTPMQDYDRMNTPQLKREIQRFGIKPVSKKRMIVCLKDIYQQTHQYETDPEVEVSEDEGNEHDSVKITEEKVDSKETKVNKKSRPSKATSNRGRMQPPAKKPGSKQSKKASSENPQENLKDDQSCRPDLIDLSNEDDDDSQNDGSCDSDMVEESFFMEGEIQCSQQESSPNLHQELHTFFTSNPELYCRVLMYEPLELDWLRDEVKKAGIKCSVPKLIHFMDERCITFTMKSSRANKPRGRRKKAKKKTDMAVTAPSAPS